MEKITEKFLLEKCSPNTNKLEQIKTLNLSKLGLKTQDLPVRLLSRLKSLQRWDLSGNRLQEFPKNLELPALHHLDLSDNQMEDVTSLESLCNLEELKMEDNFYITVSDNYKLMVLLPKLKLYNGKDVTATSTHLRSVYSGALTTRIAGVWEKSFSLPDPITEETVSALETSFVNAACQQVKYGPSSVSSFTKWRVEILAKEYLHSLVEPKEEEPDSPESTKTKEINDVSTPVKRKRSESPPHINLTPRKKLCAETSHVEDSPRKSSRLIKVQTEIQTSAVRTSPRKTTQPPSTPSRGQTTPKRSLKEKPGNDPKQKENLKPSQQQKDANMLIKTHPVALKPLHVLQCHSRQDSPEDFSTQLWACAFQPLPHLSSGCSGGSRLVATCGGDSVCVIDCETGMVMKKYKVSGEEFFSLAWSTVLMSRGNKASAQHCSVLAAGGKRGVVKLIHPRNNVAYGEFRASRKALSVLRFNQQQGNLLFTGTYDSKIVMWDIGGVDSHYNFKVVQLMVLEMTSTPLHICLPPSSPSMHLLAASEDGLHCYNTQLTAKNTAKSRTKEMEITFPIYDKEDKDNDFHTVDGLSFLNDDIVASKNCSHGFIYLWSWSRTKSQRPDKKNKTVRAVILAELQWANTEIPYLALNTCPGRAYIVCGDDKGKLWTYHITNLQTNNKPILPTEVLEWPTPVMKTSQDQIEGPSINNVTMDPELQYLVALSDKNMVIVWKREE